MESARSSTDDSMSRCLLPEDFDGSSDCFGGMGDSPQKLSLLYDLYYTNR